MLDVKVKKLIEDSLLPTKANKGDAAYDLYIHSILDKGYYYEIGTGISMEIPEGYAGYLYPRSSIYKYNLVMSNSVGIIDSGYRGEIKANLYKNYYNQFYVNLLYYIKLILLYLRLDEYFKLNAILSYRKYDRALQIEIKPINQINFIESDSLSDSDRGKGGFGSSGI